MKDHKSEKSLKILLDGIRTYYVHITYIILCRTLRRMILRASHEKFYLEIF